MGLKATAVSSDKYDQLLSTVGGCSVYGRMELMTFKEGRYIVKGMGSEQISQGEYDEILAQFERDHTLAVRFEGDDFTYTLYYHSEKQEPIEMLKRRLMSMGVTFAT